MTKSSTHVGALVSICVPTYNRPALLQEALASCVKQDYRPIEIIVGDDSTNDASRRVVEALHTDGGCTVRHVHNRPSLGQAGNVNMLFREARGERLVLLHDDDLLLPNAVTELARCWAKEPSLTVAFGKQLLITMSGEVLPRQSRRLNDVYYRTSKEAGICLTAMESALLQQFPNDGYMIRTSAAREVGYRNEEEVGTNRWCDFDFGIRLASAYDTFYFLDKYVAKYRLTDESVSSQGTPYYMFPLIESLYVEEPETWAQRKALERLAPTVVHNYARLGKKKEALSIYFSEFYPRRQRASLKGLYHLMLIYLPGITKPLRKLYDEVHTKKQHAV